MRPVSNWRDVVKNRTPKEVAQFIIDDLTGYRASSSWKKEDIDNLTNAIEAIIKLASEI